jgi:hypothetical protein
MLYFFCSPWFNLYYLWPATLTLYWFYSNYLWVKGFVLIVQFMMLLTQTEKHQIVGWLMNKELKRMWKEGLASGRASRY